MIKTITSAFLGIILGATLSLSMTGYADEPSPKPTSGANQSGPYDPTTPGVGDNQGNGNAPGNGTVGNADGKNPPGQQPGGSDNNNGYECDGNNGVGNNGGNPAHTGCTAPRPRLLPHSPQL